MKMVIFVLVILILTMYHATNAACDFDRLEMENCFVEYYSSANRQTDPICGTKTYISRLDRVKMCIKVWEKVFLKPKLYLQPRDSSYLGTILTPDKQWNFNNECVPRRVTFLAKTDHEDMLAYVFECPMHELQFSRSQTISNFYMSYGGEPNSVFYYHNVLENPSFIPKSDESGTMVIKIEHWIDSLNRIPDLERGQLMWTLVPIYDKSRSLSVISR